MSRELQNDTVSSVDRSSRGIAEEQPVSQSQQENVSTEPVTMTSDAVPAAAETNLIDDPIIDEPSSVSNQSRSPRHESEDPSNVSIARL